MVRVALFIMLLVVAVACEEPGGTGTDAEPTPPPTATPTPLAPLPVQLTDLLTAYELNKFQADAQYKFSENGGRWLLVTGYVVAVEHEDFTLVGDVPKEQATGLQALMELGQDDDLTAVACSYANDEVRLSPALLVGEWVTVMARGEGEGTFGGVGLNHCHEVSGQSRSEVLPTPTSPAVEDAGRVEAAPVLGASEWTGSGQAVISFEADEGIYVVNMAVTGNNDCAAGACVPGTIVILLTDTVGTGHEVLATEVAAEWQGQVTLDVGGTFGLSAGLMALAVDAAGEWRVTITKQ